MASHALDYLSHSRLYSYRQCSLKFRFQYVDRLKGAFVPAPLVFGSAFHKAVEEALVASMAGAFLPVEELVRIFSQEIDAQDPAIPIRFGEKENRETMIEQATRMLSAWVSWERPPGRLLAAEHEFRIPIAEWLPPLVGRIDEILELEDHVAVIDVKTSRSRWSDEDVTQHASQLALYRAGAADILREIGKPVRMGFEVITKTKSPTVERIYVDEDTVETLDRQIRAAKLVVEAVERGIHIPSPGWQCSSCPYREACRGW